MITLLPDEQEELLVPLKKLHTLQEAHIPGAELAQRPLCEAQVVSLAMADPATWPKIVLTRTKEYGLVVVDGYHRWEAAKRQACVEIRASIRVFTNVNTLIEAAFQANLTHGVPASATTRSDYAYWLFISYPEMKQTEIATRVGLKPPTVNTAIKRRERERQAVEEESRTRREALAGGWSEKELEWQARHEEKEQQCIRAIQTYVHHSTQLYEALQGVDSGERYQLLKKAIAEKDKIVLARACQYIEQYLKDNLPPDLMKSLKPTPSRRPRKASDPNSQEGQDH